MGVTNYHSVNGMLLGETRPGGERVHYLTDAVGSVVATMNDEGVVLNTYRYKPFGELLAKTGTDPDPRFLWTGATGSRVTGLRFSEQYNRARHYGTRQAQWTTVDPLWPIETPYGYVGGNPTTWNDASGLKAGEFACWDRKPDPCKKFEERRKPYRSVPTPCGPILVPPKLTIPVQNSDDDAWCCWERRLRAHAGGFGMCMMSSTVLLIMKQLELQALNRTFNQENDKYIHCMIGCLAQAESGSCCAYFLSIHLENKYWPAGNHDPADYVATIKGMRCGEGMPEDGFFHGCELLFRNVYETYCMECCRLSTGFRPPSGASSHGPFLPSHPPALQPGQQVDPGEWGRIPGRTSPVVG